MYVTTIVFYEFIHYLCMVGFSYTIVVFNIIRCSILCVAKKQYQRSDDVQSFIEYFAHCSALKA